MSPEDTCINYSEAVADQYKLFLYTWISSHPLAVLNLIALVQTSKFNIDWHSCLIFYFYKFILIKGWRPFFQQTVTEWLVRQLCFSPVTNKWFFEAVQKQRSILKHGELIITQNVFCSPVKMFLSSRQDGWNSRQQRLKAFEQGAETLAHKRGLGAWPLRRKFW